MDAHAGIDSQGEVTGPTSIGNMLAIACWLAASTWSLSAVPSGSSKLGNADLHFHVSPACTSTDAAFIGCLVPCMLVYPLCQPFGADAFAARTILLVYCVHFHVSGAQLLAGGWHTHSG